MVVSIARECGSCWSYTPAYVLIPMSVRFLCAGVPLTFPFLLPLSFFRIVYLARMTSHSNWCLPFSFFEDFMLCCIQASELVTNSGNNFIAGTLKRELGNRVRKTRLDGRC